MRLVRISIGLLFFLILSAHMWAQSASEFTLVEAGSFRIGSDDYPETGPEMTVALSRDFYIGNSELTQSEWMEFMDFNPSSTKGDQLPVTGSSWFAAVVYCNERSIAEGLKPCYTFQKNTDIDKKKSSPFDPPPLEWLVTCDFDAEGYRLPTEAEWEFAARGGTKTKGFMYSGSDELDEVAWHKDNSGEKLHEGQGKAPNELGLYDMSGNVFEWCFDDPSAREGIDQFPYQSGPSSEPKRIMRGGSYDLQGLYCRTGWRMSGFLNSSYNNTGFRLARTVTNVRSLNN